jgi:hypothetical protein
LEACVSGAELNRGDSLAKKMSETMKASYVVAPDTTIFTGKVGEDGRISYTNTDKHGKTEIINFETGQILTVRFRGTAVAAKANVYCEGKLVSSSREFGQSRVRGRAIPVVD